MPRRPLRSRDPSPEGRRGHRLRRRASVVVVLAGLIATVAVVPFVIHGRLGTKERALQALVATPAGCSATGEAPLTGGRRWPHAERSTIVFCDDGPTDVRPSLEHDPFPTAAAMRRDVLADPPRLPTCVAGASVYLNVFIVGRRQFTAICRRLDGDVVDAVTGLPEIPDEGTLESMDRAEAAQDRRDLRAQKRALQRYWGVPVG